MRQVYKVTSAAFLILLLAAPVMSQQESRITRVKFARDTTSKTYRGSVSHSINTYIVKALKGQVMTVTVASSDGEAMFSISHQPAPDSDPIEVTHDRKRWSDRLDSTGDYYISVGASRSVATYTLMIRVK